MKTYDIAFIDRNEIRESVISKNKYWYNELMGHKIVQKICFWVLGKIGCNALDETISIERTKINTDEFMLKLLEEGSDVLYNYHHRGEYLLLGPDDFNRLMDVNYKSGQMFHFNSQYHYGREMFGMKIVVIPWMSGIMVVPKLKQGDHLEH
jgi:hypothetical protein